MDREPLIELRRRTFDTPHFRGIEFIEVEAKTVINHVPGNFLPFKWTINPYRGCSHACVYCAEGETPILLADGRTKPIADIRAGDEIYGTVRVGNHRRYTRTKVIAHWSTVKPAYRIRLEDGTELVTSGDHRLLSGRGWKHVTGAQQGWARRPHLTTNSKLMGTGRFAACPDERCAEYRRGYLCGMIRGDAHLGSYSYARAGRAHGDMHRFRLALVDLEALRRARTYLNGLQISTSEFLFQEAEGARRPVYAIRTSARGHIVAIGELIRWPRQPSAEWSKGFLSGIFDAEGSYSRGILRIANTDSEIIDQIGLNLRRFGFRFQKEDRNRRNGLKYIRLLGGVCEALRFFHSVDPAITRKRSIEGQAIKNNAKLRVVAIEPLGLELPMFDISTSTGDFIANGVVSHNCFARVTHTYMDMNAGRDFESKIVVKVNAPDVLRQQLRSKRWKGEHIAMGTATDPYQRAEGRYGLMPAIMRALVDYRNPFSILTKGTLILRDLELLQEAASVTDVSTAFSVGTLDSEAWRRTEPGTPHPRERMEAVAKLNESGIPCGVMVAPVLPGITDDPKLLRQVVGAAVDAGATHVSPILLHLRPVVREEFMGWLNETYPGLVGRYEEMYRKPYASVEDRKSLGGTVGALVRHAGGLRPSARVAARLRPREPEAPPPKTEQLGLL